MSVITVKFKDYKTSLNEILEKADFYSHIKNQKRILIKPNLVNTSPPPVTTPLELCMELILRIRSRLDPEIIIAEGTGAIEYDTDHVFRKLGYTELSKRLDIRLVDLNKAPTRLLKNPTCSFFPEFHMPEIMMDCYLISVPVLKAHSFATITGSLKNMMGCAQPKYYQSDGFWKKSLFHKDMHRSIIELNRYRCADFTIMDATVGLPDFHLGGSHCDPPVNKLIAGFNPVHVDRKAAELLGFNWKKIPHLCRELEQL